MTLSLTSEHLNIASGLDTETMFLLKVGLIKTISKLFFSQ